MVTRPGARGLRAPGATGPAIRSARGAAAAEAAVVMPILTTYLVALLWILSFASVHLRVVDAARETARAAARADSEQQAVEAGRKVAPDGAVIKVSRRGDDVVATVKAEVSGPAGLLSFMPFTTVSSSATARLEDR